MQLPQENYPEKVISMHFNYFILLYFYWCYVTFLGQIYYDNLLNRITITASHLVTFTAEILNEKRKLDSLRSVGSCIKVKSD